MYTEESKQSWPVTNISSWLDGIISQVGDYLKRACAIMPRLHQMQFAVSFVRVALLSQVAFRTLPPPPP